MVLEPPVGGPPGLTHLYVNRCPLPFHASPRESCRSSCLTLTRRRTSTAPALSAIVRRELSRFGVSSTSPTP